jgi:YMGG-like Gly-zipper
MKILCMELSVVMLSAFAMSASADLMIYPKNNQSAEQQSKDKYECHDWAVKQTGFDPLSSSSQPATVKPTGPQPNAVKGAARGAAVGAVGGAIAGDAGKGAAAGAAGGAMVGGMRRRDAAAANAQANAQAKAANDSQRSNYDRAVKTCLEGRNYSVN